MTLRIDRSEEQGTRLLGIFTSLDDKSGTRIAATAAEGQFLSTDDPDTIIFRLKNGRLVQEGTDFATPRTLSFESYDLPINLPAIDPFRGRGNDEKELVLPELFARAYLGAAPDRQRQPRGAGQPPFPAGRGCDDADAAVAGHRAGGAAQAQQQFARHLHRDRDGRHLSQDQSICGKRRRPGTAAAGTGAVAALPGPRRADRLDVPCHRPSAGRAADRRARGRVHQARQDDPEIACPGAASERIEATA